MTVIIVRLTAYSCSRAVFLFRVSVGDVIACHARAQPVAGIEITLR